LSATARIVLLFLAITALRFDTPRALEETTEFGQFGAIHLYHNSPAPPRVVLFVSGDGGWNLGVIDMARALASLDALVVGIDVTHFLSMLEKSDEECVYPASDFELLSKFVQKKLDFPDYVTPVLVGYSSGATLVYAALVQAPSNTFLGAISLGFCPSIKLTKKLCPGYGLESAWDSHGKGQNLLPATTLERPWIALQGTIDQVCAPSVAQEYVGKVKNGEIVMLPKVGHGFSVQKNWMPQFKQAFEALLGRGDEAASEAPVSVAELRDLPLAEVPAIAGASDAMAVFLSGDGGWSITERTLSDRLSEEGIPVVGLNSLRYFWVKRTPDSAARDLERIIDAYRAAWAKSKIILIGYSSGASVLPFMANRLTGDVRALVTEVVLLGPEKITDFEFHFLDWLTTRTRPTSLPVLPEVEKLRGVKVICIYGAREGDSLCPDLPAGLATTIERPGGHLIGFNIESIAKEILGSIE
jgi:type IV secretory pathway VirJ component